VTAGLSASNVRNGCSAKYSGTCFLDSKRQRLSFFRPQTEAVLTSVRRAEAAFDLLADLVFAQACAAQSFPTTTIPENAFGVVGGLSTAAQTFVIFVRKVQQ